ncbi:ABC transporter permease [Paenibacillus sp. CCS19]|uniref:ABC transporter permease n=1 Tax=Paenibacillus sp. CCS19 TaxID=3158387 RepID=UPI00256D9DE6|nr:ABC transporter permease subunit [Paenibacillus cellulosilyticus]GMK38825.1 ABC transporter permease [Paenibacillus cellulosilyticus]
MELPSAGESEQSAIVYETPLARLPLQSSNNRGWLNGSASAAQRIAIPLLAFVLLLTLWQLEALHRLLGLHTYQLPLPSVIASAISDNAALLLDYAAYTLTEAVIGLLAGAAAGFGVALAATAWPRWGAPGIVLAAALNAVPIVALAPIMNLWFGGGIGSRSAVVAIGTMAVMAINAHKGMRSIDPLAIDLMHSYAASKREIFLYLRLPASLPYIATSFKICTTASMIGAIVGEFFFSSKGLGYLLSNSIKIARMPLGWSCIVIAAAAGVLFYLLVESLERLALRWHPSQRD